MRLTEELKLYVKEPTYDRLSFTKKAFEKAAHVTCCSISKCIYLYLMILNYIILRGKDRGLNHLVTLVYKYI